MNDRAGRDMDEQIARRLFQLDVWRDGNRRYYKTPESAYNVVPRYCRDLSAAFQVLLYLRQRGLRITIELEEPAYNAVTIIKPLPPDVAKQYPSWADAADDENVVAATLPQAICYAAIQSLRMLEDAR